MSQKKPHRPSIHRWNNVVKIKMLNKSLAIEFLSSDNDEFGICIKRLLTEEEVAKQGEKPLIAANSQVVGGRILKSTVKLSREALEALHYATRIALSKLNKTPKNDSV